MSFDGTGNVTPGVTGTLGVANGGTGKTTLTSGYALIGNGTAAVSLRAITATPSSGSTSLFTAGGAYTLAAGKQDTITVSSSQPTGATGRLWFQTEGSDGVITIKYYDGSSWVTKYPKAAPNPPYLCTINSGGTTVLSGVPAFKWSGSSGNYSCTITRANHGKGAVKIGSNTFYFPNIVTYTPATNGYEITYDSPFVASANGNVTVYSNTNDVLYVAIS